MTAPELTPEEMVVVEAFGSHCVCGQPPIAPIHNREEAINA